jgi:hypothetical protein
MASVPTTVKDYQQKLATLAAAHAAAQRQLEAATARRAAAVARHDGLVADAEGAVRQAVVDMAAGVGVELTAQVLGVEVADVRKLAKDVRAAGGER